MIVVLVVLALDGMRVADECFFFCKQKTAYEMRISDWSSDVCSSDRPRQHGDRGARPDAVPAAGADSEPRHREWSGRLWARTRRMGGACRFCHAARRDGDGEDGPRG